jgi:hypothetical protein
MGEQANGIHVTEEDSGKRRVSFLIEVSFDCDDREGITELQAGVIVGEEHRPVTLTPFASIMDIAGLIDDHVDMGIIPIQRNPQETPPLQEAPQVS